MNFILLIELILSITVITSSSIEIFLVCKHCFCYSNVPTSETKEPIVSGSKLIISLLENRKCLDTRQPGTVFKELTGQSEILTNFLEIARLIPLRT